MDWHSLRKAASEKFNGACRVCPVCNGVACAGEVPGMGGLGTGSAFKNNVNALAGYKLNLRTVHKHDQPKLACALFGAELSLPVIGAAIGGIAMNMNGAMTEEAYAEAVVSGCCQAGVLAMTGDGPAPAVYRAGLAAIRNVSGKGIPIIKPRATAEIIALAKQAEEAGAVAFGIDIDAAALVNMTNAGQPVGPKTRTDLAYIKQHTNLPFIVKGIMTPDEAAECQAAGVDAIVVSNHGGRALDHTPGTVEVLPYIAEAVNGNMKILIDGGIRSGADVLKMLALGANAVLIGRPIAIGAVGGGIEGVQLVLDKLKNELTAAMILTGTADVSNVSGDIIW